MGRRDDSPRDASTWNRRPAGAGDYKTVVEVSGRDQLAPFRVPSNPRDLKSVCEARTEARLLAKAALAERVTALEASTEAQSAAEAAWAHHDLAQLLGYENGVVPAIAEAEAAWRLVTDPQLRDPGFETASEPPGSACWAF